VLALGVVVGSVYNTLVNRAWHVVGTGLLRSGTSRDIVTQVNGTGLAVVADVGEVGADTVGVTSTIYTEGEGVLATVTT